MLGFLQRMENTRRLTEEAAAILDSEAKKRKDTEFSRLREILEELNDESR